MLRCPNLERALVGFTGTQDPISQKTQELADVSNKAKCHAVQRVWNVSSQPARLGETLWDCQ